MSRCGLRKLYFRYASVNFYCYFTVNRTNFSAQLAYGKMTLLNFSFMFEKCKVKNTAKVSLVQIKIFTLFRCCKRVSLSKATNSTQFS